MLHNCYQQCKINNNTQIQYLISMGLYVYMTKYACRLDMKRYNLVQKSECSKSYNNNGAGK